MVEFSAVIEKFAEQGEKTGWTYIKVTGEIAMQMVPGNKKGFRVKGLLDAFKFEGMSLIPIGGGDFILPLNAGVRKSLRKSKGAILKVKMEVDNKPFILCPELMECLPDEPAALAYFNKLPGSHQKYYSKWIDSAKTEATKAKRIAQTINACAKGQQYGEMMRSLKKEDDKLAG